MKKEKPISHEFDDFKALDRDALKIKMAQELPEIRKALNVEPADLADKIHMDEKKLKAVEAGKRKLKWTEYMSILFIFWNNDIGRGIVESKGLFPDALKKAMSVNRNAHPPMTENGIYEV